MNEEFTIRLERTATCYSCGETITAFDAVDRDLCVCGAVLVDGQGTRGAIGAQWENWADAWERDDRTAKRIERFRADWRRTLFREGAARC